MVSGPGHVVGQPHFDLPLYEALVKARSSSGTSLPEMPRDPSDGVDGGGLSDGPDALPCGHAGPAVDGWCPRCAALTGDAEDVAGAAAELLRAGRLSGRLAEVAFYDPPGRAAMYAEHEWQVRARRTGAVVLAHDAFEAARWFVRIESGHPGFRLPHGSCFRMASDLVKAELAYNRWCRSERAAYLSAVTDIHRERLARARSEFLGRLGARPLP